MQCDSYPMNGYADKAALLDDARTYWNPDKTDFWVDNGIPMVLGRREGYEFEDIDGNTYIDMHLNGGTFNLGHRNPEVIAALVDALGRVDIGNHHFPTSGRAKLAKMLIDTVPGGTMDKVVFGSAGGEVVDVAIKSARYATGRRKIVSVVKAYHGHTGLSIATGDERFLSMFHCERPDEFTQVPFNDLDAMEDALKGNDVAAVIMETIPATYGFPMPAPGYLAQVKALCERYGALYIADEVQTGLGRTVDFWCFEHHGLTPDIVVTSKGLSGGIYPVSACILNQRASGWLSEDGFAHMGTFGGSELGMQVAMKVIEITRRPGTVVHVKELDEFYSKAFDRLLADHPSLVEVRHDGTIAGLKFAGDGEPAVTFSKMLYDRGVWAIFSTLDKSVLQFKSGLLLDMDQAENVIDRIDDALDDLDRAC
ncbi:class III aminotransferase [Bifidobacterium cuniculi]|uniref:Class III aminotransferase n=2 Tax=Bifidobacterium cuniculi TaxID=1688 RepID=A0A087AYB0_9BIFI|nr:class III aminotransferase [Bifidobacterium cuniculi]